MDGRSGFRIPLTPTWQGLAGAPNEVGLTSDTVDPYLYSSTVFIGGRDVAPYAYKDFNFADSVTLEQISNVGITSFLLQDPVFDVHRTVYDMGEYPNGSANDGNNGVGHIAFYTRGNAYKAGGGYYNDSMPRPTDRQYFIGPIY